MYAEVSLALKQRPNTLSVPVEAIERQGASATVLLVNSQNQLQERQVQLGIETSDQVEVLSGLNENDLVVVGNRSQLRAGMTVRPKLISNALTSGGI
jgi:multidrug efflux pump subunit AcrA (membrane-fusion protein)